MATPIRLRFLTLKFRDDGRINGENPVEALVRELDEEGIKLIGSDEEWHERFGVDYFDKYGELSLWFVITVADAEMTPNPEIHEWAWVQPDENPWHPGMGALIKMLVERYGV